MLDLAGTFARNMTHSPQFLLVTGASGRVGRLLRAALPEARLGGLQVMWAARNPGPGIQLAWDMGRGPVPNLPAGTAILHLAGHTAGSEEVLADNAGAALAVAQLARQIDAPLLHMSSAAVLGPASRDLTEDDAPAPTSAYGRAKLQAETVLLQTLPEGRLTVLRLANLAGADMLFGNIRAGFPVTLDPIPGQPGGPIRSYVGPRTLARTLDGLIRLLARGQALPRMLNLAQPGAVAMADVLEAAGARWSWGPPRAGSIPRVTLSTERLGALVPLFPATPKGLIDEVASLGQTVS